MAPHGMAVVSTATPQTQLQLQQVAVQQQQQQQQQQQFQQQQAALQQQQQQQRETSAVVKNVTPATPRKMAVADSGENWETF